MSEDNTINIRMAVKSLSDVGIREELNVVLSPLKGEFEVKVEETLANINNGDRFVDAWDSVNLLVNAKSQANLRKLLLLRIVNELHSGINVTAKNKTEIKSRIDSITDSQLKTLLTTRLNTSEEVQLFAPSDELKKSFRKKKNLDMGTPASSLYDDQDVRSEITKTPSQAGTFLLQSGQTEPIKV